MSYKYSETSIEKSFLYLLGLSLLIHVLFFVVMINLPQEKKKVPYEPIMIDLQDISPSQELPQSKEKEVRRFSDQRHRVAREMAPRGEMERERLAAPPRTLIPSPEMPQKRGEEPAPWPPARESRPLFPEQPGESPLKPREEKLPQLSQLFPSARNLAQLEESYRKKYGPEVAEGETRFLNTDDIQFGSFLRRFETAVYGVWTYPADAARLGIEGVTPVKITFNRNGEIENVSIIESSGSKMLDNEVLRTLRMLGPIGPLPKGYAKDRFNLIAFFQYGINRGGGRGVLH